MEDSNKTYHTLIAKRILIAEAISFAIGVPLLISEPIGGIYYYALWFSLAALINATAIIFLLVRKPKSYLKYSVNLFVLPIACAWILYFVIGRMM